MMNTRKVVLFDLGNVLVSIHPAAFTHHLGIDPTTAYKKYQTPILRIVRKYESGEATTEDYLREMSALFDRRYETSVIREAMLKVIGAPMEGMEELVRLVATKHEIGLVSNTNELHFDYCLETLAALRHFNRFYLSYRLGAMKPSDSYYRAVLDDLRVPPEDVVFIDDLEENAAAAGKNGMTALRFVSREQLRRDLANLALL